MPQKSSTIRPMMTLDDAKRAVARLHVQLGGIVAKDKEQEVRGLALPVLDAVVTAAREHLLPGDPVIDMLPDLISADAIAMGEPIRAVDAYLAVSQIEEALNRASRHGGREGRATLR